jgi:hypothetical protein
MVLLRRQDLRLITHNEKVGYIEVWFDAKGKKNFAQGVRSNVLAASARADAPHCVVYNGLHLGTTVPGDECYIGRTETSWSVRRRTRLAGAEPNVPKPTGGISTGKSHTKYWKL